MHAIKAKSSILVTLLGMTMLVNAEQQWKALSPILVTPFGIVISVNEEQLSNAPKERGAIGSICLRLVGRIMLVNVEQPLKVP